MLAQTYGRIEVLVVNDGSSDGTGKILESYAQKKKIRLISFDENKGLSAARNAGINVSRGDYISFLDADDVYLPEKVERQVRLFDAVRNVDIVVCSSYIVWEEDKEKFYKQTYESSLLVEVGSEEVLRRLAKGNFININTAMIKKRVFESGLRFDGALKSAEDLDFWLGAARKEFSLLLHDEPLVVTRIRSNSNSADLAGIKKNDIVVMRKHFKSVPFSFYFKLYLAQGLSFLPPTCLRNLLKCWRRIKYKQCPR